MIIIADKAGQLGNKIALFAHFISYSIKHDIRVYNFSLEDDAELFETTHKDLFCRFPNHNSLIKPSLFLRKMIYNFHYRLANYLYRRGYNSSLIKVMNLKINESISLDDSEYISVINNTAVVMIKGYEYRHLSAFKENADVIRKYFTPRKCYLDNISELMKTIRSKCDVVVGVHIRQGDYAKFMNGSWYYTTKQYVEIMRQLQSLFQRKRVGFLVCSNEPQKNDDFAEFIYEFGTNVVIEDLYSLSQCDYIVGPPSSFNSWAAFYGKVPILYLSDHNMNISLDKFKIYDIPNC